MVHSEPTAQLPENRALSAKVGLRRLLGFLGPAYLVSVGYMDPGNWATDLEGGSRYGYALLWVVGLSSLMAVFLQTLCARLGLVSGRDLAQACRAYYPRPVSLVLYGLAEIAIVACDVAEVIGSAVALSLLFGLDLRAGVVLTGFDVLLLLGLGRFGVRKIEALVIALVATIFVAFGLNLLLARPDFGAAAHGLFVPSLPGDRSLLIAVGILGATVMPHNLYLHSSIVKSRAVEDKREGVRMATLDTVVALAGAFLVNAAILLLAAAVFHPVGKIVTELEDAHRLLAPALGGAASTLFAVALLASGQSSTLTGTMAGQIVMEGFTELKVQPWVRRLVTRLLAIVPAMLIVIVNGHATADALVVSQIVLSLQLPFAVLPLILFTGDRRIMGEFANPKWMKAVGFAVAGAILVADGFLLGSQYGWTKLALGTAVFGAYFGWAFSRRTV